MENIETLLAAVAQTQGFDDDEEAVSAGSKLGGGKSVSSPEICGDSGAPQSIGVPVEVGGDSRPLEVVDHNQKLEVPAAGMVVGAGEKRKRGRPPRGQLAVKPLPLPPKRKKQEEEEEEDVCFICFDGGSLVLCDRKGCPKAYHPTCIKRDEAYFSSKAKWNCGWHICSVCQKSSHYICYTCTYSLCKACNKDTDYLCVRGNKGFCITCMRTIMLIENKDQANSGSVQVDFDDQGSWEYLFKVYWICLKEKLSLTLNELTHAKKPWKGVPAVVCNPQLAIGNHTAHDEKVSSHSSPVLSELSKPQEESYLSQNNQISSNEENGPSHNKYTITASTGEEPGKPIIDKNTDKLSIDEVVDVSKNCKAVDKICKKDGYNNNIIDDTNRKCISNSIVDPRNNSSGKPESDINAEWASKELLEFVRHMKNGDTSALSQFDVQTLLLDYIKRNNLRDPHQKSQIICDYRLQNLFGKLRVGHIEMLSLLEFHFLWKENSQKNSFIPAGFVDSTASDVDVNLNNYGSSMSCSSKKRKTRKKSEEREPQNNANGYAAIDTHNINFMYLRRNLLENLIEDKGNFHNKVVGSIVRIRIVTNDQRQDTYRLVQVIGTSKVAEPYKIGDRTTDIVLEVLNLNKKEVVSIDVLSNSAVTEDECRRLRQSIRCGLGKQFTVGDVQKIAVALQPVRIDDCLKVEMLRLNHLRDRANEKGLKKELREHVHKLQLLQSPEERQKRISEVPVIHDDPTMSPTYESEEDARNDEIVRPGYPMFSGNGRNPFSPKNKGNKDGAIQGQNKIVPKIDAGGSHSLEKQSNQVNVINSTIHSRKDLVMLRSGSETSTANHSIGNSPSVNNIETEKLWHYRDPNGKTQGPFAMLQLRKWNTTGLFPPDMRIWTNHEQYDSVFLVDALNRQFHGASETPCDISSESHELGATGGTVSVNRTAGDIKQTEAALCTDSADILPGNHNGLVRADESGSSWPQEWNLLKDKDSGSADVETCNLLPSSSLGQTNIALPDLGKDPQNEENKSNELFQNQMTSSHTLQNQYNNQSRAEENLRSSSIDLSAMTTVSVFSPLSKSPYSTKEDGVVDISNLPNPAQMTHNKHWGVQTVEKQQPVSSDASIQNSGIFKLLSPTPRSNSEDNEGQVETKQSSFINFIVPNSDPSWSNDSGPVVGGLQLPEAGDEWCGYSPTPAKPSIQVWNSDLVSPSSLKPSEVMSDNVANSTSNGNHLTNASSIIPNWLAIFNEPIELDALGEESVSDLLAEVDAMESQGGLPSPTSAMKFAKEFIQDCKDDCFSSIEFSPIPNPGKRDALSSTGELQLSCQSSVSCRQAVLCPIDGFDSFRRSSVHSSASSEGETNAPVYPGEAGSDFHTPAPNTSQEMVGATMVLGMGTETNDPSLAPVQGNINLVTVQGNVNLVLGGPSQEMTNLGWGTNPGSTWPNPNVNITPTSGSLPWDSQRKYIGERFPSPREWAYQGGEPGFGRGRPPWSRQTYGGGGSGGGGGYSRPPVKGQRVCKFYESGRCKKGAFCDYLHP